MKKKKNTSNKSVIFNFKNLSKNEFQLLGEYEFAYIKPINKSKNIGFVIHGADGAPMGFSDSKDLAILAVKENNMVPVSVH